MSFPKQSNWKRKQTAPPPKPKKVRKLAPLASEEQKQQMQIGDLTYDFACRIARLFQYLTEDSDDKEFIISKQIMRSGTSIGANVSEGQNAQSKADFLSTMTIASKEANETNYWLRHLHDRSGFARFHSGSGERMVTSTIHSLTQSTRICNESSTNLLQSSRPPNRTWRKSNTKHIT